MWEWRGTTRRATCFAIGFSLLGLMGCSSGTPAPSSTTSTRTTDTQLDLSDISLQPTSPSTSSPTTASPSAVTPTTPAPPTIPGPALPPGVTEADRAAVAAAAIRFDEVFFEFLDAFPNYDPGPLRELATVDSSDVLAIVEPYKELADGGYRLELRDTNDRIVRSVEFESVDSAVVTLCLADDAYFLGPKADRIDEGLSGTVDETEFRRAGSLWLFVERRTQTVLPDGTRCVAS